MNNLDELSKPVAEVNSKYGDPEAFGERELKVLADIQKMPYETKFYSQGYIDFLIAQLEAAQKERDEATRRLIRYSMSAGEADQRMCESRAVRDELGFEKDADDVAPIDLRNAIVAIRERAEAAETAETAETGDRCSPEVYEKGVSACFVDIPRDTAEIICRGISAASGCAVDWHYIGGRVHIKVMQKPVVRQQHADWSNATFGNVGPVGPLKHLSKEALETAASPGDLSEWADMQFLFWDAQRRASITDAQIEQAMIDKLEINKSRVWPEPKDGEPREHIKAGFTVEGSEL